MNNARSDNHAARSGTSTGFDPAGLPEPLAYYESIGLVLSGKGEWRTTACDFHGGSDSMRINLKRGGFICMAGCGARGGDVLAYEMARTGNEFAKTAKSLGAWVGPSEPFHRRPTPITARDALRAMAFETSIVAMVAADLAKGMVPKLDDLSRLLTAVARINSVQELFA